MSATTSIPAPRHATGRPGQNRARRLLRGPQTDPRWARPALFGLLALTAVLYLWDLGRNGWANDFYAAAVQAGTKSWKAFFFGSFDQSSFITVDKTPGSLWVMELSGRIFGFSQWSMLAPQALEGVGSVLLLYAAVKRWFGPAAGLIAGLVLALTPVAALMFRFNNPDALLVLLMTAAAYTLVRAVENGRTRWLVLTGLLLGFAFLAKMLQAFLVVPGFAAAYLCAGPPRLGRRIWQTVLMGAGIVAGAGWWILAAQLTPAADRPYFGGSTNNSILQLAIGYNGLGRLTGNETGSVGPAGNGQGGGGQGSLVRRRDRDIPAVPRRVRRADQLAAARGADLAGRHGLGVAPRGADRPDPGRGAAVGRLGAGDRPGVQLHERHHPPLLHGRAGARHRRPGGYRGDGLVAGAARIRAAGRADRGRRRRPGQRRVGVHPARPDAGLAAVAALGGAGRGRGRRGPGAGRPGAGPAVAGAPRAAGAGGGAARPGPGGRAGRAGGVRAGHRGHRPHRRDPERRAGRRPGSAADRAALPAAGAASPVRGRPAAGTGREPERPGADRSTRRDGDADGSGASSGSTAPGGTAGTGAASGGMPGGTSTGGMPRGGSGGFGAGNGPGGGLGGNTTVSSALTRLLEQDAASYTWVAATEGSEGAAPLELATGDAVMAIGGFNGTDPWPTLAVFKELVAKHEIHYYVGQGSQSFGGGRGSSAIAAWVAAHFTKQTVGGQTVYDLTKPLS